VVSVCNCIRVLRDDFFFILFSSFSAILFVVTCNVKSKVKQWWSDGVGLVTWWLWQNCSQRNWKINKNLIHTIVLYKLFTSSCIDRLSAVTVYYLRHSSLRQTPFPSKQWIKLQNRTMSLLLLNPCNGLIEFYWFIFLSFFLVCVAGSSHWK
jgi:hypothetical protein